MKTTTLTLTLALLLSAPLTFATPSDPSVEVVANHHQNQFVFKVKRKFVGATVEIRYYNGDVVMTEKLTKRKMVIDFAEVKAGAYTIRITNGKETDEYQFIRK